MNMLSNRIVGKSLVGESKFEKGAAASAHPNGEASVEIAGSTEEQMLQFREEGERRETRCSRRKLGGGTRRSGGGGGSRSRR